MIMMATYSAIPNKPGITKSEGMKFLEVGAVLGGCHRRLPPPADRSPPISNLSLQSYTLQAVFLSLFKDCNLSEIIQTCDSLRSRWFTSTLEYQHKEETYEFKGWKSSICCCVSSPALDVVAVGCSDVNIYVHNIRDAHAHDSYVISLHFFANEPVLMSTSADNSIKMWIFDTTDGDPRLLKFRSGHTAPLNCIKRRERSRSNTVALFLPSLYIDLDFFTFHLRNSLRSITYGICYGILWLWNQVHSKLATELATDKEPWNLLWTNGYGNSYRVLPMECVTEYIGYGIKSVAALQRK
ncbi:hypothetical protein LXL04_030215 [Taraxacum kok-saghyz]